VQETRQDSRTDADLIVIYLIGSSYAMALYDFLMSSRVRTWYGHRTDPDTRLSSCIAVSRIFIEDFWLPPRDSNPDMLIQSQTARVAVICNDRKQ